MLGAVFTGTMFVATGFLAYAGENKIPGVFGWGTTMLTLTAGYPALAVVGALVLQHVNIRAQETAGAEAVADQGEFEDAHEQVHGPIANGPMPA